MGGNSMGALMPVIRSVRLSHALLRQKAASKRQWKQMAARILALDLGRKRIGLAVSDALGLLAHGLPTLERKNLRVDIGVLHALAVEHEIAAFLIGLPRTLDGSEGSQAAWVRDFAERLAKRSKRPAVYWDERLTSVEAEERLHRSGRGLVSSGSRLKGKGHVDQMAAVVLLQEFLDAGMPNVPWAQASEGADTRDTLETA